ncbi:hypothetical protein GOP47_0025609 [Adiantum capillus-veneris]|uniref:Uncharacterized protein n=1 Tax=Adiantum capillus-veneris TaxID=13818 RepID=A0A9D4Z333_ADICA|nr:hypothetical protein GOP47_0025609 [Adiantum capillus-veneris]
MASGVMSLAGTAAPTRGYPSLRHPASRPVLSDSFSLHLHPASSALTAARALTSSSSSCFSGVSIAPRIGFKWEVPQRNSVVKVRAGKPALGCTKRSRSRKTTLTVARALKSLMEQLRRSSRETIHGATRQKAGVSSTSEVKLSVSGPSWRRSGHRGDQHQTVMELLRCV